MNVAVLRCVKSVPGLVVMAAALAIGCSSSSTPESRADPEPVAAPKPKAAPTPAPLQLAVTIDGKAVTWDAAAFAKVAHVKGNNNEGEARDVWSLRDLVHQLVGPNARVVSITGNATRLLAQAAWDDARHTPILQVTRRVSLKYRWMDPDGTWGETDVKDVTKIEVVR